MDFDLIYDICSRVQDSPPEVTVTEVQQIIKTLKTNKAADGCGLVAKHLKFGGKPVAAYIAGVQNSIFRSGKVSEMFKLGCITHIYKQEGHEALNRSPEYTGQRSNIIRIKMIV